MIPPFRFFELYQAIKLHFQQTSYDFFRYGGKTRSTEASFMGRKDKIFFERTARRMRNEEMAIEYIVTNFVAGKSYIRNFEMSHYNNFDSLRDSYIYKFNDAIEKFMENKDIVELYFKNEMEKEFIIILDMIYDGELFKRAESNILFDEVKTALENYKPFVINSFGINKDIVLSLRKQLLREIRNSNEYYSESG